MPPAKKLAVRSVPKPQRARMAFEGTDLVITLDAGAQAAAGDPVAAFIADALIATAPLRLEKSGRLTTSVAFADAPPAKFPATLRLQNQRTGAELRPPDRFAIRFETAAELLAAVGPPAMTWRIEGVAPDRLTVAVAVDRLARYPRALALEVDGVEVAVVTGLPAALEFVLPAPLRRGQALAVRDMTHGVRGAALTLTAEHLLDAALATIARLGARLDAGNVALAGMQARLDSAVGLGRDRMLLDRLDLFYLMLNERIDREMRAIGTPAATPPEPPPPVLSYRPSEIEGVGMFDLETNGHNEWRWFSPDVTLIFRDVGAPVSRIVLQFHNFGEIEHGQAVQVSMAGTSIAGELRRLPDGIHLLEIPVRRAEAWPDGSVILHLAFARHYTTAADPRLLSAVFSGAEIFTIAPGQG